MTPVPPTPSVLITGAAGTLGTALCREFSANGWSVFAGHHRNHLPGPLPGLRELKLDVTSEADWQAAAEWVRKSTPALTALIHNAGIADDSLLLHASLASWDQTLATNLRPAASGTRHLLPLLTHQTPSHVVLVSSLASSVGGAGQSVYASAKAALVGLGQSLAQELAPHGVRVNTVFPGVLPGPMTDRLTPAARARLIDSSLLRTPNDPAEVARFIRFLLSTRNISGQVFNLDSRIRPWC